MMMGKFIFCLMIFGCYFLICKILCTFVESGRSKYKSFNNTDKHTIVLNNKIYNVKLNVYYPLNLNVPENIIDWLNNYQHIHLSGKLIFIINNDMSIDIKKLNNHDTTKYKATLHIFKDKLPDFIRFNEVDCDFNVINTGWDSSIPQYGEEYRMIKPHDILNLLGCPKIVYGNFTCKDLGLTTFIGCPEKIYGNLNISNNKLSAFSNMPNYIQGCLNISNNMFNDDAWDYVILHKDDEFANTDFNTWNFSNNLFIKYDKVDLKQTLL